MLATPGRRTNLMRRFVVGSIPDDAGAFGRAVRFSDAHQSLTASIRTPELRPIADSFARGLDRLVTLLRFPVEVIFAAPDLERRFLRAADDVERSGLAGQDYEKTLAAINARAGELLVEEAEAFSKQPAAPLPTTPP
jgi:hypothetical protein